MVFDKEMLAVQGKTIKLRLNLNCKSNGIYVSLRTKCNNNYVGQTKNSFSTRWTAHRFCWNRSKSDFYPKDITDETALFRHYYFKHKNDLQRINFDEAYQVVFLEEPDFKNLDYKENFWINKLKSDINLAKTQYSDL